MSHEKLFTPLAIADLTLRNRSVMAPLTRMRAGEGHVPTPMNAEYYAQRASAGLIIAEGTAISPEAHGYRGAQPTRSCERPFPSSATNTYNTTW